MQIIEQDTARLVKHLADARLRLVAAQVGGMSPRAAQAHVVAACEEVVAAESILSATRPLKLDDIIGDEEGAPAADTMSADQAVAWEKMVAWVSGQEPYFLLRGYAGTGKTWMMRRLHTLLGGRVRFSATTNKASKVLGQSVGVLARTIHSVLGLRMVEDDDRMVLARAGAAPYISPGTVLVVDEASMVGRQLYEAIQDAVETTGVRVMFVGDPAQLPPVGEQRSPVWDCTDDQECRVLLRQVMRNDDLLLDVATRMREQMRMHNWRTPLTRSAAGPGVEVHDSQAEWREEMLRSVARPGERLAKVIAYRNAKVDQYNAAVRARLGFTQPFEPGDVVLLAQPLERDGQLLAHTDDEFLVERVVEDRVRVDDEYLAAWTLTVSGDSNHTLYVCRDELGLRSILSDKAAAAKSASGPRRAALWQDFWSTRRSFQELRYGYALTSHRSQGSTLEKVFLDQEDILSIYDKRTAFRSLYVAATRPSKLLSTF